MLFQWLRKGASYFKNPPVTLSEEAWRALLEPDPPRWIPVGEGFMLIEDVRKRVDYYEYLHRTCLRYDNERRKEWEDWQQAHPYPNDRNKLIMIK